MKKKILTISLAFMLFFLIPISTLCISGNYVDPKNDVLILENYNYQFDLRSFSINDKLIREIKNLDFEHSSNKPTIDITKVAIDNQGTYTEFVITVKEACSIYPSGDSNVFILIVVIKYEDDIFGAIHIKYGSLGSVSKYGKLSELSEFQHITMDDFEDFELSNLNGELSFDIPTKDLPDGSDELYVIISQATVRDLDIDESNIEFFIGDIYGDVYPNKIYGETETYFPETEDDVIDDSEDDIDDTTDQDINPFIWGFGAMLGFIIIISGFVFIQGRKT